MGKIQFYNNRILKLSNVLKHKVQFEKEDFDLNVAIEQMQSYIKTKGAVQVGPLIQHTKTFVNDAGELDMEIVIMLQCNNFIHTVEAPYSMEAVIRVTDAMYCRYVGPEDKLKLAYDKINLEAFENDIKLSDCNYTIFISINADDDIVTADVFIPKVVI